MRVSAALTLYVFVCAYLCIYKYIYIYIYRERERYIYIYIYTHRHTVHISTHVRQYVLQAHEEFGHGHRRSLPRHSLANKTQYIQMACMCTCCIQWAGILLPNIANSSRSDAQETSTQTRKHKIRVVEPHTADFPKISGCGQMPDFHWKRFHRVL